jgi:hypothetical protein
MIKKEYDEEKKAMMMMLPSYTDLYNLYIKFYKIYMNYYNEIVTIIPNANIAIHKNKELFPINMLKSILDLKKTPASALIIDNVLYLENVIDFNISSNINTMLCRINKLINSSTPEATQKILDDFNPIINALENNPLYIPNNESELEPTIQEFKRLSST